MNNNQSILIVDDEKNIRLTMSQALKQLEIETRTAVNGEEALEKMKETPATLMFLDLKMPGMDGMQVLKEVRKSWPGTRVIIITAHGNIEKAVEAMKIGAVDFIQKPFSPSEIRTLTQKVLDREKLEEGNAQDYNSLIELAKRYITDRDFTSARDFTRKAISEAPENPEAYNLLGALLEIKGDRSEALKFYRAARDVDPNYKPALINLERATSWEKNGRIIIGQEKTGDDNQKNRKE
ncbi:TPA: response regulator [Candidatus Marinimicrobia bacterium]|nr:response regulator [Candidatus Neomarinimicrobiota bacterium]